MRDLSRAEVPPSDGGEAAVPELQDPPPGEDAVGFRLPTIAWVVIAGLGGGLALAALVIGVVVARPVTTGRAEDEHPVNSK